MRERLNRDRLGAPHTSSGSTSVNRLGSRLWKPTQIGVSIEHRVGCEVRVVGIILADTRLKGDEILAVTDSFMCVAVHPCRVNKTIRIAASAVMDYLESCA